MSSNIEYLIEERYPDLSEFTLDHYPDIIPELAIAMRKDFSSRNNSSKYNEAPFVPDSVSGYKYSGLGFAVRFQSGSAFSTSSFAKPVLSIDEAVIKVILVNMQSNALDLKSGADKLNDISQRRKDKRAEFLVEQDRNIRRNLDLINQSNRSGIEKFFSAIGSFFRSIAHFFAALFNLVYKHDVEAFNNEMRKAGGFIIEAAMIAAMLVAVAFAILTFGTGLSLVVPLISVIAVTYIQNDLYQDKVIAAKMQQRAQLFEAITLKYNAEKIEDSAAVKIIQNDLSLFIQRAQEYNQFAHDAIKEYYNLSLDIIRKI